jgi:enoyl-CoA hydratase/carnithine racemase
MAGDDKMADAFVEREDIGAIARLTLNAPHSLNALSDAMLRALMAALEGLAADPRIRVVILKGSGKAFCAGHDLREMQAARATPAGASDGGRTYFAGLFGRCAEMMQAITALPQPVIAQVHGIATAAGCQLVATCDLALAAQGTRFGVNGVNIGLFCSTPMVALSRNVPNKIAFEMLTTGQFIAAERAAEVGLINIVTAPEMLEAETLALAQTIAAKLGAVVKIGKRTFYDQINMSVADAYRHTGAVMVENMLWRDTNEGINAFLEKRAPDWNDAETG